MPISIEQVIKFLKVVNGKSELEIKKLTSVCELLNLITEDEKDFGFVSPNSDKIKSRKEIWNHIRQCKHCGSIKDKYKKLNLYFNFRLTTMVIELRLINREEMMRKINLQKSSRRTRPLPSTVPDNDVWTIRW
jgi:hypothetical protein